MQVSGVWCLAPCIDFHFRGVGFQESAFSRQLQESAR